MVKDQRGGGRVTGKLHLLVPAREACVETTLEIPHIQARICVPVGAGWCVCTRGAPSMPAHPVAHCQVDPLISQP